MTRRLIQVLFDELPQQPQQQLHLPVSSHPKIRTMVAIAVGVIVSWLGGRGVTLMGSQPQLVAGLLVGTVLGVALFRGVPVGPLIAAGLVSLIVGKQ